jgi:hypothetical protein
MPQGFSVLVLYPLFCGVKLSEPTAAPPLTAALNKHYLTCSRVHSCCGYFLHEAFVLGVCLAESLFSSLSIPSKIHYRGERLR